MSSDNGFYRYGSLEEGFSFSNNRPQQQQRQPFTDYGLLDGVSFNIASPPIQTCLEEASLDLRNQSNVGFNYTPLLTFISKGVVLL